MKNAWLQRFHLFKLLTFSVEKEIYFCFEKKKRLKLFFGSLKYNVYESSKIKISKFLYDTNLSLIDL